MCEDSTTKWNYGEKTSSYSSSGRLELLFFKQIWPQNVFGIILLHMQIDNHHLFCQNVHLTHHSTNKFLNIHILKFLVAYVMHELWCQKEGNMGPWARNTYSWFQTFKKGYILFDLKSRETFLYRNVVFYEAIFSFFIKDNPSTSTSNPIFPMYFNNSYFDLLSEASLQPIHLTRHSPNNTTHNIPSNTTYSQPTNIDSTTTQPSLRQSSRSRRIPTYLQDYHCSLATCTTAPSSLQVRHHL